MNQYLNQIFVFMISAESHTPKNKEKLKNIQNVKFLSILKKKKVISRKIQKQTNFSF